MNLLTLSDIEILIHYHVSSVRHPRLHVPAVAEGIDKLLLHNLIDYNEDSNGDRGLFHTTPKGKAFIQMLCTTPLPIQAFINPLTQQIIE